MEMITLESLKLQGLEELAPLLLIFVSEMSAWIGRGDGGAPSPGPPSLIS
jgi:hypothetical protein